MPELTPLGDTFFEARVRAIVAASFLNSPSGGFVASDVAVTSADHRRFDPALCDEDLFEAACPVLFVRDFAFVASLDWMPPRPVWIAGLK